MYDAIAFLSHSTFIPEIGLALTIEAIIVCSALDPPLPVDCVYTCFYMHIRFSLVNTIFVHVTTYSILTGQGSF